MTELIDTNGDAAGGLHPADMGGAEMQVMGIYYEIMGMGFNDWEGPAIEGVLGLLRNGDITPQEAMEKAYSIKESKQDYH